MDATGIDIRTKYIELAKKYHPDVATHSSEIFKEITHAYTVLSNATEKAKYDQQIGNYDKSHVELHDIHGIEVMHKKKHSLTEDEQKEQESEFGKVLARKHQREQDMISQFVNSSFNRPIYDEVNLSKWRKEHAEIKKKLGDDFSMDIDEFLMSKQAQMGTEVDHSKFNKDQLFRGHHYQREEKGAGFNAFERFSGKLVKLSIFLCPFVIGYVVYVYMSERNMLENTAKEFVKRKQTPNK